MKSSVRLLAVVLLIALSTGGASSVEAHSALPGGPRLAELAPEDLSSEKPSSGRLAVHPDRVSVQAVDGTFNTLVVLVDDRVVREFHGPAFRSIRVVEARRDEFRALLARLKSLNRKVLVNVAHSTTLYRDSSGDILEASDIPIIPYEVIEQELERLQREIESLRQTR